MIDEHTIRAIKDGNMVAVVEFEGSMGILAIPDATLLANRRHRKEFNPREFGFGPQPMNWRKEADPYVIKQPVPNDIPGLQAPVKVERKLHRDHHVTVRRSV